MPKRTTKSTLKSRISSHVSAHQDDETDFGFVNLPGGIKNGVAKLIECKFDKYKKGDNEGEYYFIASGIVVEPAQSGGMTVKGLRTQIMEAVCETTTRADKVTSEAEHVANIMNTMRMLGADTTDTEDLEELAAALKEAQPHFRFSTSLGKTTPEFPDARVWENWHGAVDYEPQDEGAEVEEEETEEEVGELPEHGEAPPDDEVPFDGNDLNALAEAADKDDEESQQKLLELAASAGIDEETRNDDKVLWSELADMIAATANGDEEETEEKPEEDDTDNKKWEPEKGEVYNYKPPRARKSVECEVTAVAKTKQTCSLKNLDTNKLYQSIPWSKLEQD